MFHRIAAVLIVLFWLTMTALLIERRFFPESSRFSKVPAYHIGQIFFQQEQVSDLMAYKGDDNLGYARVSPRSDRRNGINTVDFSGALKLQAADGKHTVTWLAQLDLNPDYKMRLFHADIFVDQIQHVKVLMNKMTGVETFSIGTRGEDEGRLTYSLDQNGFSTLLKQNGMDASMLAQLQGASGQMPPPEFSAQESSLRMNNETIATYLLSMKLGENVIFEIHMSQIGQVLKMNMPLLNYKLLPYNVDPVQ